MIRICFVLNSKLSIVLYSVQYTNTIRFTIRINFQYRVSLLIKSPNHYEMHYIHRSFCLENPINLENVDYKFSFVLIPRQFGDHSQDEQL